jgi:hypothetical protein
MFLLWWIDPRAEAFSNGKLTGNKNRDKRKREEGVVLLGQHKLGTKTTPQ